MRGILFALLLCAASFQPGPSASQDARPGIRSPVLVVDSEALFRTSTYGKRVAAQIAAEFDGLEADNRRIEAELKTEEEGLTEQRAVLPGEEFRVLADAFDEKVGNLRREQLLKARELQRREAEIPPEFLTAAAPVLETMMAEAGAVVVLERRNVFLTRNVIDITSRAVARIDAEIGPGQLQSPAASEEDAAPEPDQEPAQD